MYVTIVFCVCCVFFVFYVKFWVVCVWISAGDAGYPQLQWLMAPIRHPRGQAELKYNMAHQRTRNIIERTIGLLKSRFMCLSRPGGELLYSCELVTKIILACCVLHNVARKHNVPELPHRDREPEVRVPAVQRTRHTASGMAERERLVRAYFSVMLFFVCMLCVAGQILCPDCKVIHVFPLQG